MWQMESAGADGRAFRDRQEHIKTGAHVSVELLVDGLCNVLVSMPSHVWIMYREVTDVSTGTPCLVPQEDGHERN